MDIKIVRDDPVWYGHLVIGGYKLELSKYIFSDRVPYNSMNHPFPYVFWVHFPEDGQECNAIIDFVESNKDRIKNEFGLEFEFERNGKVLVENDYPKESKILGINGIVTRQDVLSKYRELSLQYHPDRLPNATEEEKKAAEEKFKEITAAYDVLKEIDYDNKVSAVYVTDLRQKRLHELYESNLVEEKNKRIASLVW